ncbi:MAG: universal stress protein, partial [Pseudomonadota bacterium]
QSTWNELVGSLQAQFSIIGPLADLIVVSRPKSEKSAKARAFALAALMHSARPVLVLPQRATGRVGKRILIAWNQSIDAAAIVHAALPLLQIAEDVHIMSAGSQDLCAPKTRAVAKYLRHWGVNATTSQTPGRHATQELLTTYAERKCDLFMMGAYSRARWRETVFGGLTEHILFKEHIPALLMHR